VASYSEAELEALKLLRSAFTWKVSLDRRSGAWVATYAGERIRQDDPLSLFDALTLAADARRDAYLTRSDRARADTEPGDKLPCDCCQERLEQLAAVLHEANAQMLARLEVADKRPVGLASLLSLAFNLCCLPGNSLLVLSGVSL
jgi:hypothetical protein